jgi:hypothetical protein
VGPKTNPIQTGERPAGNVAGLKMEAVRERFRSTSPQTVAGAGHAYAAAASKLAEARKEIAEAVKYLGDRWKGPAATEALQVLGKLQATAEELAAKTGQTGKALQLYGERVLPWYRTHVPEDGFIKDGGDDKYAQKLMARLNLRISQTYDGFPTHVSVDLNNIGGDSSGSGAESGAGGFGSGSGYETTSLGSSHRPFGIGSGEGDGLTPGGGGSDGAGLRDGQGASGAPRPGGAGPGGTDLAGVSPTGGAGVGNGGPLGSGSGLGPGGPGGSVPGAGSPGSVGPGGLPPGGRGLGPGGSGQGRRLAPGVIGPGGAIGGMPMAPGAGAGQSEEEHERTTWLAEDRDVWCGDEDLAPAVIGCAEPQPGSQDHAGLDLDDLADVGVSLRDEQFDLEITELDLEGDSAGAAQDPALDDDLDDLLDDVLGNNDSGSRDS